VGVGFDVGMVGRHAAHPKYLALSREKSARCKTRTRNLMVRSHVLYPLS
jgi:hypothetical protein